MQKINLSQCLYSKARKKAVSLKCVGLESAKAHPGYHVSTGQSLEMTPQRAREWGQIGMFPSEDTHQLGMDIEEPLIFT